MADANDPVFQIQRIYLKDMSLEQPNSPAILLSQEAPSVDIQIGLGSEQIGEGVFEITVTATVTTKINDQTMFLVEAKQAGIFEKINPLGGCLPVVVQIPVFIALYWVLLASVEMRHAPWLGWIQDLAAPDPWYILPVIMAASMFVQTKLNPTPPDPIQAKVMMFMPIAFSVMFFFFPSGLVLYWVVNNLLSIGQQWVITQNAEKTK